MVTPQQRVIVLRAEAEDFKNYLNELPAEAWSQPSACAGWTIADVVGHLGDGNNENGAQKLHGMMDRVREEKTGRVEQPGPIDEEEVLPV